MNSKEIDNDKNKGLENKVKPIFYPIPLFDAEIYKQAETTAQVLMESPSGLSQFQKDMRDRLFLAQVEGNIDSQGTLKKYLKQIRINLERQQNWNMFSQNPVGVIEAHTILENLPNASERQELMKQDEQKLLIEITESLVSGLVNRRFEANSNWRGALNNLYVFFQSAAESQDTTILDNYFTLSIGGYDNIADTTSLLFRSQVLALNCVAPEDEGLMIKSSELAKSSTLISQILGREAEMNTSNAAGTLVSMQVLSAASILGLNQDPTFGVGRVNYRKAVQSYKKGNGISEKIKKINLDRLSKKVLTKDQLEVAQLIKQYQKRHNDMFRANRTYFNVNDSFGGRELPDTKEKINAFPYNVVLSTSRERELIRNIVDKAIQQDKVRKSAEKIASQKGDNWSNIPFAINGLQGFIILDTHEVSKSVLTPSREQYNFIKLVLEKNNIYEYWKKGLSDTNSQGKDFAMTWLDPNSKYVFLLSTDTYSPKSTLEGALDTAIPLEIRSRSMEILRSLIDKRYKIPRNFTRLPTIAGDQYNLVDHNQLLGVFSEAFIGKRLEGGLVFKLNLINGGIIAGNITFPQDRLQLVLDGDSSKLPEDLKWIIESTVLALTERSCCRPLSEKTGAKEIGDTEREEKEETSSGGFLTHVGGFRKSGERKQFTEYAAGNFQTVIKDMAGDTGGLSLVFINTEHRKKCERYVTWNKGWEKPDSKPISRKPPEKLLTFND